jgi:hypothetical protein
MGAGERSKFSRLVRRGMALFALSVSSALALCSVAAASMQVTSTGDGGGVCTLRGAIEAVNEGNSGTGCGPLDSGTTTINLPANHYTPTDGQLVVEGNLAIVGADESEPQQTVIDAGASRVIEVKVGGSARLVAVEITGGHTADGGLAPDIYSQNVVGKGGGVLNHGTLILEHALVTENQTGKGSQGANAPLRSGGGGGGEGGSGGGIFNDFGAYLLVKESTISKNHTGDGGNGGEGADGEVPEIGHYPQGTPGGKGGSAGDGGGIYNVGNAVIEASTISGNFTGRGGNGGSGGQGAGFSTPFAPGEGGDGGDGGNSGKQYRKDQGTYWEYERGGGGIFNAGPLTISSSTISGNETGAGGNAGSSGSGGAKETGGFATSGRAGTGGGAGRGAGLLSAMPFGSNAQLFLTNVTIYGNRTGDGGTGGGGGGGADNTLGGGVGGWGGDGGGIYAHGAKSGAEMTLAHVTIAGNGVGAGGLSGSSAIPNNACCSEGGLGAGLATSGRYDSGGSGVYEKNSIIADNGSPTEGPGNCSQRDPSSIDIFDLGGNVTWNDTTCPGKVANPKLGLLADNGGLTKTLLPGSGSAAIGAVPAASCTVHEDQRGEPRPGAGRSACDAGAVETQSGESPPEEEGGGEEEGEQPGGGTPEAGGSSSGSTPAGSSSTGSSSTASTPPPAPSPKPLHCRKGFKKKPVKGKPRCVKKKKHHPRHRHP